MTDTLRKVEVTTMTVGTSAGMWHTTPGSRWTMFASRRHPPTRFDLYPHELSGGMRQRIMIALVLVADPDVIIADEATTALEVPVEAQIVALLAEVKARGTSLVFITHNLGLVARVCHDVAVMYAGRIVERGPVAEVFANRRIRTRRCFWVRPSRSRPLAMST